MRGTVSGMEGIKDYGTSCELHPQDSALRLEIANVAAAYCQLPEGTPVLARGYVCDGRMEVTHTEPPAASAISAPGARLTRPPQQD